MGKSALKLFNGKKVLFSQRMDYVKSYDEWRDTIDQRISIWIERLGGVPIAMPNALRKTEEFISYVKPEVIVLTGGNTVSSTLYDPDGTQEVTHQRDKTEKYLLRYATEYKIPVLGICRGFQMINVYFGGALRRCNHHIATRHLIRLVENELAFDVNSFHGQAVTDKELSSEMKSIAVSDDGLVEAIIHKEYPILGVQWHPERENMLKEVDLLLMRYLLEGGV